MTDRLLIAASVYFTRRDNFQAPLQVETPNLFLNTADLAAYLGRFMPEANAQALAAGIGGLPGNPAVTGIPLATVSPEGRLGGPDIIMTYRNSGRVDLWGAELAAQALFSDTWSAAAALSWLSDDFIPQAKAGGFADIALNAPRKKATVSVAYRDATRGWSAEARTRLADHFPMTSGVWVGNVRGYNLLDATATARLPFLRGAAITVSAQNLADQRHAEFFGAPPIGRLVTTRLHYTF
jgi:iron complex outermembrane receptor protein